jgi:Uma2 family endonuclease
VVHFVHDLLKRFTRLHTLGRAIQAPFVMHLPNVPSPREPDVIFVDRDHLDRLRPPVRATSLEGPGDLVVEVVSPDSRKRDYEDKFHEYARGGVPEYWIIDIITREAHFYRLDAQGTYQPNAPDAQGIHRTPALPGFWLNVDWLWQDPLPEVDAVLQEIATTTVAQEQARHASDAYVRELLDELRRLGRLPDEGSE